MTPPVTPAPPSAPCPAAERRSQLNHLALVFFILLFVGVGLWLLAQRDLVGGKLFLIVAVAIAIPARIGKAWAAVRGVAAAAGLTPAAVITRPDPATPAPAPAPSAAAPAEDVG